MKQQTVNSCLLHLHISTYFPPDFSETPSLNFKEVLLNGRASCESASNKIFLTYVGV